ncbi:MAG: M3 family oligoendopeptidase [Candidatus Bipolaricaulaceae bacterium]
MSAQSLPRWDWSEVFPGLETPEFEKAWQDLEGKLAKVQELCERHKIGNRDPVPEDRAAFWEIVGAANAFLQALTPIRAFLQGLVDTESTNPKAQAKLSELQKLTLGFERLRPRFVAWLARLDPAEVGAGPYRLLLEEARVRAQHMMSEAEEVLAAELTLSGGTAWAKLHGNVSSLITAEVGGKKLPITAVRNLAYSPDERVRKEAYEAELAAWKAHEVPLAAALNGVKGEASTLNRKRGWKDDLEPALFRNRITREILAAMQAVVEESFPLWRRYFLAKAKALGKERLDWWDLFAPVGQSAKRWTWAEAQTFIVENLSPFSPAAAAIARTAFERNWIDAEPRVGKRGGAYCTHVGQGKSRILANYEESFDSVSTLAHELGHAYHNWCLRDVPPLLRQYPMTLAETASILNETVVVEAALATLPEGERLPILETYLQGAAQVVVDIHSRFLFESWVFARRAKRELTPDEFCALMVEAQKATYGEALATYHPYMWAVKPHYYGADFYNFPYTFGLLFGLGLYERYREEGEKFLARYEELLASVGMYPVAELAQRFGFDLSSPAFWRRGMGVLAEKIEAFAAQVGG